jgi:CheY-like chemotaxis protein
MGCRRDDVMMLTDMEFVQEERRLFSQNFLTGKVKISLQTYSCKGVISDLRSKSSMVKLSCGQTERPCILVVDDHDQVRCLLKEWLEAVFPDFGVVEAKSGEEAVVVAQAQLPKLVIMDIGLPEMDGIRATQLIKQSVPEAKVVILTMHEDDQYQKDAFACGVNVYIPKRLMQSDLLPALQRLLVQGDAGVEGLLGHGKYGIN